MLGTERAFLMVWDGLRPDLVDPEITPNLWRLAESGARFEQSHAVYPSLTRANSPAISTGYRPGAAGVPGNTFLLRETDGRLTSHSSGDVASLERLAAADHLPTLLVDTLADRVHAAGGNTVVVGSGSPGSAWLQHPRALDIGEAVIADGLPSMRGFMDALQARFGALPPRHALPATRWTTYFTRVIAEFVLPEVQPKLLVFWHTDPDHTAHARGYFAPETRQSLRDADANLGAILAAYERLGLRESTAFAVTSDHGGSTVSRRVNVAQDFAGALAEGAIAANGGSVFVYSKASTAVQVVRELNYVGPVFTPDGRDNTFPFSLVGLDGPRAPDLVFSFRWSSDAVHGIAGTATSSNTKLVMDHGSISPYDLHNTLVLAAPEVRAGLRSDVPVGNIDVHPTLAHLLGLPPAPTAGRVLHEALRGSSTPDWDTWQDVRTFTARGVTSQQRLWFNRVGEHSYLAGGTVEAS
jgi:arylsulfatase A-like enzyme